MSKLQRLAHVRDISELRRETESPAFVQALDEREAAAAAAAERRVVSARRQALETSGIRVTPDDVEAIAHDRLIETPALKVTRQWLIDHQQWDCVHAKPGKGESCQHCGASLHKPRGTRPLRFFGLLGPVSIGKTVAAAWACARVGGYAIKAGEIPRILAMFERDEQARRIVICRLLVIDDLGTEPSKDGQPSPFFSSALYELIDERLSRRACLTLITSNLSRANVVKRYEPRTIARLDHEGHLQEKLGDKSLRRGPR